MPYRSQYDGSPYQDSNCGPAALAMVLQAYGVQVTNLQLRADANQLQGTSSYDQGIALDFLQGVAQEAGLRTEGLIGADGHYKKWSMADLIREVRRGYPVITLVHYATLPDHASSHSTSDHYVVVVGVNDKGFVVNDPAFTGDGGYRRLLGPDALTKAWQDASIPDQAVAFLPPVGKPNLALLNTNGRQLSGESNQAPIVPTAQPPLRPAPLMAPGSSWTLPAVPSPVPSGATDSADSAMAPPPGPTTASWAVNLGQWKHAPPRASAVPIPTALPFVAEAASERPSPRVPLATLLVAALIASGALVILKLPGSGSR